MSQRFSSRVKKKDPNCDLEPRQSNSDSRKESEEQGEIGHQREPKPKRKRQSTMDKLSIPIQRIGRKLDLRGSYEGDERRQVELVKPMGVVCPCQYSIYQMMVMVAVGCKLWSLQSKWLRGSIQLWYGRPSRN
ncbi:hypothetical protein K1719_026855 [Acacia pycnantha]|nr:hypothetical protein K1719_026855 [Acacia pycnantha]